MADICYQVSLEKFSRCFFPRTVLHENIKYKISHLVTVVNCLRSYWATT